MSGYTYPLWQLGISGNTAGATQLVSSGTLALAGGNNITLSQAGNAITISGAVGGGGGSINFSAGTTSNNLDSVVFSNSNALSFGLNGSTITGSYTVPTVTNSSWTVSDNATSGTVARLAFTNLNGVTLSLSTGAGGSHTIVGSHNALTSQSTDYNAVTLGGNTAGTTTFHATNNRTLWFNGGNNITLSGNGSTITISAFNQSVESQSIGMNTSTAGGVTGGTSGYASGAQVKYDFFAGSNITMSQSVNGASGSLSVFGPAAGAANINFSAGTTSNNLGSVVFSNSNGVSFGLNGSTITASVAGVIDRQFHEIIEGENLVGCASLTGASFSKRPIFVPFWLDGQSLSCKTVRYYASRPAGTTLNMSAHLGFYSMSNSTRIDLVSSTSHAYSLTASVDWSGIRVFEFTGLSNLTLSEGRWIMGLYFSGSNNSTAVANLVLMGGATFAPAGSVLPGTNSTGATNTSNHLVPFWGVYSNTTGALPATVGRTEIAGAGSDKQADVYALIAEI